MKKLRVLLATLFAVSAIVITAPAASAEECYPGDPCQPPCGDKINAITRKLYGDDLITCPW